MSPMATLSFDTEPASIADTEYEVSWNSRIQGHGVTELNEWFSPCAESWELVFVFCQSLSKSASLPQSLVNDRRQAKTRSHLASS